MSNKTALSQRLAQGKTVLCAEGYLFEVQRRGYLQAGSFVPEVVLEHPDIVRQLHEEFVHAGSDVVQAFTYYGHREKLRLIDREADLEKLNLMALKIAREVADKHGLLMAGNICNSTVYVVDQPATHEQAKAIFKEEVEWAVKGQADFVIAETYGTFGEAVLALEAVKKYGEGLDCVVNMEPSAANKTLDGVPFPEALARLEAAGAVVVGLNCCFGPASMIPAMKEVRERCKGPIACLPVPYRTDAEHPQMQTLVLPDGKRAFFDGLDHFYCTPADMNVFGKSCQEIGVQFVGICCGNSSRHFRSLAESFGRKPPASKYSTDMSMHFAFGDNEHFHKQYTETFRKIVTPKDMRD